MGMKEIESVLKIVDKKEAEYLDKNTNITVLSKLAEDKFIVRFNGQIADNIRKLYKSDPLIADKDKMIYYTKEDLRKTGLNKKINVLSAVHIAAAISSYARILINDYKNIPGNPCIMSDTDSAVLPKPLPGHLVGNGLGQMKLVSEIKEGIFIKKKLYYLKDHNDLEVIKSSGVSSSRLSYNKFKNLLNGESVELIRTNFNVDWNGMSINLVSSKIIIQGLNGDIKTIYNTKDSNFKAVSFPIKKNIIIHPSYLNNFESIENKKIKNKINRGPEFSYIEIIFFILFIALFISILGILLYQIY